MSNLIYDTWHKNTITSFVDTWHTSRILEFNLLCERLVCYIDANESPARCAKILLVSFRERTRARERERIESFSGIYSRIIFTTSWADVVSDLRSDTIKGLLVDLILSVVPEAIIHLILGNKAFVEWFDRACCDHHALRKRETCFVKKKKKNIFWLYDIRWNETIGRNEHVQSVNVLWARQ